MAENALDLFYRHSFIYSHSGESATEFMWVNLFSPMLLPIVRRRTSTPLIVNLLLGLIVRRKVLDLCRYGCQGIAVDGFGSGIENRLHALCCLSEDYALAFVEIQIVAVHSDEFSDSHSGGGEQVNEGKVADFCAVVA